MTYTTDYHIHSTFSDGRASPEEYISPAISAGLSEIGFSEHLTLYREEDEWFMKKENLSLYLKTIDELRKTSDRIVVRTGFEVEYFRGREKETGDFLKSLPLDYIIGSVHYLGEWSVDHRADFYEGRNINDLFELYFNEVCAAAESGLFDIIGHCDLVRIYGYRPSSDPEHLYRKLAKSMKKGDVAFEVNTNGRNRPLADFYPDRRFLGVFRDENIPVCVNSDAHMPSRVGQYFNEAYELLRYIGFTEMAVFENRKRKMIPF